MENCKESSTGCCCFHPKEVVVGVCASCLKERLLQVLASEEGHRRRRHPPAKDESKRSPLLVLLKEKAAVTLPKIFALGSFMHLADSRHSGDSNKGQISEDEGSIFSSLEDSFISIKLEAVGEEASGGADRRSKEAGVLRWRKRIGKILRLGKPQPRWFSMARACHVGGHKGKKEEEAKARGQQRY